MGVEEIMFTFMCLSMICFITVKRPEITFEGAGGFIFTSIAADLILAYIVF